MPIPIYAKVLSFDDRIGLNCVEIAKSDAVSLCPEPD